MSTHERNPPQSIGGLIPVKSEQHQHAYQVIASDMTIVRWCPSCGRTWKVIRYANGGLFTNTWEEIREP
jgi:hypothetical protein